MMNNRVNLSNLTQANNIVVIMQNYMQTDSCAHAK